jgi:hypothetical protein
MNHYDNPNRRTSLKDLEFNMNMDKIDAFELDFDADLAVDDFDKLLDYNKHDIRATELFFARFFQVSNKLFFSNCSITPIQMINPCFLCQLMSYLNCTSTFIKE